MPSASVTITETGDMSKILEQLPIMIQRGALDKALAAAGKIVVARAKELCPKGDAKRGERRLRKRIKPLAQTIRYVVKKYDTVSVCVVGTEWPHGAHGHLVEFGHDIARQGTVLQPKQRPGWTAEKYWHPRWGGGGGWLYRQGAPRRAKLGATVAAPIGRVAPRPFLRPAADETRSQQDAAMMNVLRAELAKAGG